MFFQAPVVLPLADGEGRSQRENDAFQVLAISSFTKKKWRVLEPLSFYPSRRDTCVLIGLNLQTTPSNVLHDLEVQGVIIHVSTLTFWTRVKTYRVYGDTHEPTEGHPKPFTLTARKAQRPLGHRRNGSKKVPRTCNGACLNHRVHAVALCRSSSDIQTQLGLMHTSAERDVWSNENEEYPGLLIVGFAWQRHTHPGVLHDRKWHTSWRDCTLTFVEKGIRRIENDKVSWPLNEEIYREERL